MHCPACGHENQAEAKFCSNCGNSLAVTCPTCAAISPAGTKFCNNCGTNLQADASPTPADDASLSRLIPPEMLSKLRAARAGQAMAGERRTVTMLFADVKGSTAAAEQMDPEEWADLINAAFERLIEPIYRYEGTLARLLGDAVLAFFGAPIAHEDDPIRAIRAGLDIIDGMGAAKADILDQYGVPIDVRVGVNTGLVVVGEVGSDLRVEYTALGDAINVAARMEQTAEPGTIQVSERTFSLTHGAFEAEDLGKVEVKGKAEPIRTFRPTAFVGAADGAAEHGLHGRDAELARLVEITRQLESGNGWIVSLIGEAGLGKSALLREWERLSLEEVSVARGPTEDGSIAAMTGASQSYDASKPFSGIRNVLERWFAFDGIEDFAKIAADVESIEDPDIASLLGHVSGIPLPEREQRFVDDLAPPVLLAKARTAVIAYIENVAARRPLVIAFEDLHWSDDLTVDLIADLLAVVDSAPVGLAFAMRPYRDDPSWRVHERAGRDHAHRYETVELRPLDDQATRGLLEELVGDLQLSDAEVDSILERAAGNPLFIEELGSSLATGGTVKGIPDSLAGVLGARLDRLDDEARLVAQVSSVLGTEFRRETIGALVDDPDLDGTIRQLFREQVLIDSRATPGRLQFRHALLQDAAYESVLLKTRRRLHGEVARHLATNAPDATPDIARHYVTAGEMHQAFPYLVEAGVAATRAMALNDAIRDFRLALDNVPDDADADNVQRAHLTLGEAYALLPNLSESAAAFQRLFDYGEATAQPTAQVAALNQLGFTTATVGGDAVQANEYLRQAKALAEKIGDDRGLAVYHMNACMVAAFDGDVGRALAHDAQTEALGEAIGDEYVRVEGLRRRAMNSAIMLDFEQAEATHELAIAAAEHAGSEQALAELEVLGPGMMHFGRGRYREANELISGQVGVLERYASFDLPIAHSLSGQAQLELGNLEAALSSFDASRRAAATMGQPFTEALGMVGMGAAYAALGQDDQARELLDAASIGEGPMGDYFASSSWYYVGLAHRLLGEPDRAVEASESGLAASSVVQFIDRSRLLLGLAGALIEAGDLDRTATIIAEAREFLDEHPDFTGTDPTMEVVIASLAAAHGEPNTLAEAVGSTDEAGHAWSGLMGAWVLASTTGEAADIADAARRVDDIANRIIDESLRDSFVVRWSDPVRSRA